MSALVSLEHVSKRYARDHREPLAVLRDVSLAVGAGESIGVIGLERAGKSTLLRVLAGLLAPDEGVVRFDGRPLHALSGEQHAALLRDEIGLADPAAPVSQRCERVVDHVALVLLSAGRSLREASVAAREALAQVGAGDCADRCPPELTRSEQARVSIARALVRRPRLLLVDEPAAMPRPDEIESITKMVRTIARERGTALVMASQDPLALRGCDRIVHVTDGALRTSDRRGTVVAFPRSRSAS